MILDQDTINKKLQAYRSWEFSGNTIHKTFRFPDFMTAVEFINKLAVVAEHLNHHPDISLHYNQLTFHCTTHSEGGVTEKDFKLVKEIEQLMVE